MILLYHVPNEQTKSTLLYLVHSFTAVYVCCVGQPKQLRNFFFGVVPVARCFAAVSWHLIISCCRLASTDALSSSATLWIVAIRFLIFSAYSAFFFSSFSCKDINRDVSTVLVLTWYHDVGTKKT